MVDEETCMCDFNKQCHVHYVLREKVKQAILKHVSHKEPHNIDDCLTQVLNEANL